VKFEEMTRFPTYVPTLMLRPEGYVAVSTDHVYLVARPAARLTMVRVGPVVAGCVCVAAACANTDAASWVLSTAESTKQQVAQACIMCSIMKWIPAASDFYNEQPCH
jgi:hypothetical protein